MDNNDITRTHCVKAWVIISDNGQYYTGVGYTDDIEKAKLYCSKCKAWTNIDKRGTRERGEYAHAVCVTFAREVSLIYEKK